MFFFLIINMEHFTDNFICIKCQKIKELQEKLIDLHMKLHQVTERNMENSVNFKLGSACTNSLSSGPM